MPDILLLIISVCFLVFGFVLIFNTNETKDVFIGLFLFVPLVWFIVASASRENETIREIEPTIIGKDVLFKLQDQYMNGYHFSKRTLDENDRLIEKKYKKWSYGVYYFVFNKYLYEIK